MYIGVAAFDRTGLFHANFYSFVSTTPSYSIMIFLILKSLNKNIFVFITIIMIIYRANSDVHDCQGVH